MVFAKNGGGGRRRFLSYSPNKKKRPFIGLVISGASLKADWAETSPKVWFSLALLSVVLFGGLGGSTLGVSVFSFSVLFVSVF